jgi:hypothetical protein
MTAAFSKPSIRALRWLAPLLLLCAGPAPAQDLKQAQLQDLEVVRTEYLPKELAFTDATRAQASARLDALEAQAGRLTPAQMLVGLAQVGALTDNAHSGVRYHDPRALPPLRLPLRLLWFPEGLLVARAQGAEADLAGARIVAIEGRSIAAVYDRMKDLHGGKDVDRRKELAEFLESGGALHALGLAKAPDRLALTLKLPSGRLVHRTVQMTPQAGQTPSAEFERLWSPQPRPGEHGWRAALPAVGLPLYLQDAEQPFRMVDLPALNARYIQFRSNEGEEGHPIAPFLAQVESAQKAEKRDTLILDLRFDIGGNITTTLAFMRGLPDAAGKRVYLLVGPYTYSAGIISAAAVKKAGGDKVIVVGDEMGDRAHFWSEGDNVKLPNSGLRMRYTNGQWDLEHGCAGKVGCMDSFLDVNFVDLAPAIPAPLTLAAYLDRRDPALDAITRALGEP